MSHNDIYQKEHSTKFGRCSLILYKEGEWLRAYEYSAFLAYHFPGVAIDNRLNPNRRFIKNHEDGIIVCGLRDKSLDKYFPGAERIESEETIEIYIPSELVSTFNEDTFAEWKMSFEIKEQKQRKNETVPDSLSEPIGVFTTLMRKILKYPIENRTPEDAYKFIRELKDIALKVI